MARLPILCAVVFAAACLIVIGGYYLTPPQIADAGWYIKIAEGDIHGVIEPFSGRVFHPLTARLFSSLSGEDIHFSFWALNIFALAGFVFVLALFFSKLPFMNVPIAFSLAFTPFLLDYFRSIYYSELFYGFLVALFFYFLWKKMHIPGLLVLFLTLFTRPSEALILGVVVAIVAFFKSEKRFAATVLLVVVVATLLGSQITALGQSNIHNLGTVEFFLVKPVYNFFRFIIGVDWLTNTMAQFCEPKFSFTVPDWISSGRITSVGVCGWNPVYPLGTLLYLMATFGAIPWLLFPFVRREWRRLFAGYDAWLLSALAYGTILFIIGSVVNGGFRTVGYGWPAFLLAAPFIFDRFLASKPESTAHKEIRMFMIFQLALPWLMYAILRLPAEITSLTRFIIAVPAAIMLYAVYFRMRSKALRKGASA